ncbi:unnamed protein product [Strongylus vulgaris]|uniref:Pyrroline-5-carboxylate reductase dimerisation domain-containing protein n=1 Tax=Strongylus vulgaris TaxID=40348 RepID=A0A3P7IU02_STRVU|nr:unnamed protein product [Strongylus vulgaris]
MQGDLFHDNQRIPFANIRLLGLQTTHDNTEVAHKSDVVFLAVKPPHVSKMFAVIEGLADGGVKVGLPRELAIKLAAHTLLGAAKMVLETGTHPAQLKDDVQSPGGSSVYGMHKLESGGLKQSINREVETINVDTSPRTPTYERSKTNSGLLMDAVEAATSRSRATGDRALPRDIRNTEMDRIGEENLEIYEPIHVVLQRQALRR